MKKTETKCECGSSVTVARPNGTGGVTMECARCKRRY
jgi:hypothetical protein